MKFESVLLGDVCELIAGFAFKSKDFETGEGRVIKITHITPPVVDMDNLAVVNLQNYNLDKIEKYIAGQGDFVLAMTGATIGKIGRIEKGSAYINQRVLMFKNHDNIDKDYLYYVLQQYEFEQYVLSHIDSQSAQPNISAGTIGKYEFDLPDLNMQKKIGKFLRLFDAKIELNNKINNNLYEQARSLFKNYFIDNPRRDSWEIGAFSDIVETTISGDWGKDSPLGSNTEMVYCIRGADIPEVKLGNKGKMPIRYILPKNYAAKQLVDGDIVVEISGGSPTQSTGRAAAISTALLNRYDKGMVCTNFCKALKPKTGYSMFLYHYWQYLYDTDVFFSYENGTTGIKNLNINGILEKETIFLPDFELIEQFNSLCASMYQVIYANGLENEQLSSLRDSLLPKLMSGELDVSEIDI